MDYDVIVIGAGAAGEAAGSLGGQLGARVAVVEQDLVGGQCGFWACMPSKTLLDSAQRRGIGADYPWEWASARRDWMISREGIDYPDDRGHVSAQEAAGAEVLRGTARVVATGRVEVRNGGRPRTLETRNVVVCTGSHPNVPPVEGLEEAGYWTSPTVTSLRELPSSLVVLGGGAVGVELAQAYARFGVKVALVEASDRILPREHPRTAEILSAQLREEGIELHTGSGAVAVRAEGAGRVVELENGTTVEGAELMVAVGRRPNDLRELGVEEAGVSLDDRGTAKHDDQMRLADGVFVAGDAAGGLQFTHLADYEGRIAVRAALGQAVKAHLAAVPRTSFTDPETSGVGLRLEEARDEGIEAEEFTADFSTSARGFTIEPHRRSDGPILEGTAGHITVVADRGRKVLVGAFATCPGASELIHEAVLAIKQAIPVDVLADTIHAFPTGGRVFGNLMADVSAQLG
jgi:pyruvate/2-oxoglutarate dehydrogenase complex dihydrolipoamide dehydrogenase (E3) component